MERLFEPTMDFYMCLKGGAPLCEGDAPIVFEDLVDADQARGEAENDGVVEEGEGIVAAVEPDMIVRRLVCRRSPSTGEPGSVIGLDTFAGDRT